MSIPISNKKDIPIKKVKKDIILCDFCNREADIIKKSSRLCYICFSNIY